MRLNPGVFPLQTFITFETVQFSSVADILSLGVFNSKKYVTGVSYEVSSVRVRRVKFTFPITVTMDTASQDIVSITEWFF